MPARTPKRRAKPPTSRRSRPVPKATFSSVAIDVTDRARSVAWYRDRLGLDVLQDMGHWVTVGRKGVNGMLHICQVAEIDPDSGPPEGGNLAITLKVPGDFEAACAAFAANGVEFAYPPTHRSWGWSARVRDPDGNELILMPSDQ